MNDKISVGPLQNEENCLSIYYNDRCLSVPHGITVHEFLSRFAPDEVESALAANMNNRIVSLSAPIYSGGSIKILTAHSHEGARIYRRHICMMLYAVFYKLYPEGQIRVGQSISEGYYFEVEGPKVDEAFLEAIDSGLQALVAAKKTFNLRRVAVEEAQRIFLMRGEQSKRQLLDTWPLAHVNLIELEDFIDICYGPIAPDTSFFGDYKLLLQGDDFILQFPDQKDPDIPRLEKPQPALYATLKRSRSWSRLVGVSHVGDLNAACISGQICDVIKINEALHEKLIADIADDIATKNCHMVFIAGPSSAGKTTFTKRLAIQLQVVGRRPVLISMDDYYKNRSDMPVGKDGKIDFEALEALDVPLLLSNMGDLLDGKKVPVPTFDFKSGTRCPLSACRVLEMAPDQVLLMEGIHGLNPKISAGLPKNEQYHIFINALTPLAIDNHNRIQTSDARLLRRIVRDRHYRGYSAAHTIQNWPLVRRGERAHIFPYEHTADVIFDSSLIYEFPVLKVFAERYLHEVPRSNPAFSEVYRLREFLALFVSILPGDIPQTSLLREFIGGSSFTY